MSFVVRNATVVVCRLWAESVVVVTCNLQCNASSTKLLVVVGIVLNVIAFAVVVCVFGDGINDFTLNIFDLSENYFSLSEYIEKQKN